MYLYTATKISDPVLTEGSTQLELGYALAVSC